MKKHFRPPAILLIFCLVLTLSGCSAISQAFCEHEFTEATCTESQTCTKCGKTEGEPLGHDWIDATCGDPKTCERCGETEGEPAGDHTWVEATCTGPKTCSVCGETEGEALGHDWQPATYEEPKTCARCGLTEGGPLELSITEKFPGGVSRVSGDAFTFNQEEFEELFDDALYYTDIGADNVTIPASSAYDESSDLKAYRVFADGEWTETNYGIAVNSDGFVADIVIQGPADENSPNYEYFVDTALTAIYVADASYSDGSIPDYEIPVAIAEVFENMEAYTSDGSIYLAYIQNDIFFVMTTNEDDRATLMITPAKQ